MRKQRQGGFQEHETDKRPVSYTHLDVYKRQEFRRQEATLVRMKLTVAKKVIKALLML